MQTLRDQTGQLRCDRLQPLDGNSDWRFFLTNCTTDTFKYVHLQPIRSEIGAYEIQFKEIPFIHSREKVVVPYEVIPRRTVDREKNRRATLWDFALDNAGERGTSYFWYETSIAYLDIDDLPRDGGDVAVCFDIEEKRLKTETSEIYNKTLSTRLPGHAEEA